MGSSALFLPGNPGIEVQRDVVLQLADGTPLLSDVYRPSNVSTDLPVILIRAPYDKRQAENIGYSHPSWYARQGYMVVSQDTRGRYASGGDWYPFLHEAADGIATIEWASRLPGSNGRVGMYGFSYGGATQLLPAVERPPALKAISPAFTGSQYYDGWTYQGGAFSLAFTASWALSLGIHNAARRGDESAAGQLGAAFSSAMQWHWSLPLSSYIPLKDPDTAYFFDWLDHPTYDDYWRRWSIDERYAEIDVPALHIGGWYDIFLRGTIRNFQGMSKAAASEESRRDQRLVIGPWFHMPWHPVGDAAATAAGGRLIDDLQLSWFDTHLKNQPATSPMERVTVWVNGLEAWRGFDDWPPPATEPLQLFLQSGGRANSKYGDGVLSPEPTGGEQPDVFTYDPMVPVASQGGHSCCFPFAAPMGPADQAPIEQLNSVLVYTTAPFDRETLVIGSASLVLFAATDAVDTDWTARLCLVDASGVSTNLVEGVIRARFRDSLSYPTLLEPNRPYRYEIDLGALAQLVRQGERLRLIVASSDFPQWDRNLNTGGSLGKEGLVEACVATQVVLHDAAQPSHLRLSTLPEGR